MLEPQVYQLVLHRPIECTAVIGQVQLLCCPGACCGGWEALLGFAARLLADDGQTGSNPTCLASRVSGEVAASTHVSA